jgi:hypothetical protein
MTSDIEGRTAQAVPLHPATGSRRGIVGAFRLWRRSRPFWGACWAILGGLVITYIPLRALQFVFVTQTPIWAGILVGALILLLAVFALLQPQNRYLIGAAIIVLALVSFITSDFGGLFVGMLAVLLGGALMLSWTPVAATTKRQQRWLARTRGQGAETP